ncbi:hypothetical protein CDAR_570911 [Caerostris darwini]|uniref:Uncharacterized protein n=1 Tax=Caerostris darwini TaxID=1538125 RepID=A0AAV4P271_9ARAC|nr:hypothetical protein CDAR_570911 [Caerostris darwini]
MHNQKINPLPSPSSTAFPLSFHLRDGTMDMRGTHHFWKNSTLEQFFQRMPPAILMPCFALVFQSLRQVLGLLQELAGLSFDLPGKLILR